MTGETAWTTAAILPLSIARRSRWEGAGADKGRFSAGSRGRGARVVAQKEARGRGGARPRLGRNLDGRMHLVNGGVGG